MWWFWFFSSHLQKQTDFWICPLLSVFNDAADWVLDFTLRVTDAQSALWNPDQLGCIRCGSEWNSLFIASAVKHRRRTVLLNNLFQHINFPKYINVYCRHIDYNVQYIYIWQSHCILTGSSKCISVSSTGSWSEMIWVATSYWRTDVVIRRDYRSLVMDKARCTE